MLATSRATATFCWLPPDSELASVSGSPPRTSYSLRSVRARSFICPTDSRPWFEIGGSRYSRSARFSASVKSSTSPHSWRSSGMWATPASVVLAHADTRHVPPVDGDPPGLRLAHARDRLHQLELAVAVHAGDRHHLAASRRSASTPLTASRPRSSRTWRSSTSSIGSPGLTCVLVHPQQHVAAHHQPREALPRWRPRWARCRSAFRAAARSRGRRSRAPRSACG